MTTDRGLPGLEPGQDPLQPVVARPAGCRQLAAWRSVRKTTSFWAIVETSSTRSIASKLAGRSVPPCGSVSSLDLLLRPRSWFGEGSPMTTRAGRPSGHADRVAPPRVLDELGGQRLGLVEPARPARRVAHAQRAVEHQHPVRPPAGDDRTAPKLSRNGLAIAVTTRRMISVRTASRSHCSIRIRR